jgi:hypothetical protein
MKFKAKRDGHAIEGDCLGRETPPSQAIIAVHWQDEF